MYWLFTPEEGATQINTQAVSFDSHDAKDAREVENTGDNGNTGDNQQNIQKWPEFALHGRLPKIDALSWTKPTSFLASVKRDRVSSAFCSSEYQSATKCWGGEEFEPLFSLMVEAGAVSDFELASGETAIARAAAQETVWPIKMLVDAGVHPNRRTFYTPLGIAVQHDQLETVQYLIKP